MVVVRENGHHYFLEEVNGKKHEFCVTLFADSLCNLASVRINTDVKRVMMFHLSKLQPVIFDSAKNEYRVVGEKVGTAWGSDRAIHEREVK